MRGNDGMRKDAEWAALRNQVWFRLFFYWRLWRGWRLGVDADPLGAQVAVVKEQPGSQRGVALGKHAANDRHSGGDLGQGQIDVAIPQAAAAADAAADVLGKESGIERVFKPRA